MASALWGKFASEVLKEVKFKYDHNGIRQELIEHMEELYEDLQADGMDESGAEIMTVVYMGDAKEIGQALNQEHSPILGWIWRISKCVMIVMIVLSVLTWIYPYCRDLGKSFMKDYVEKTDSPLVYTIELDTVLESYSNETIKLNELRYYEDNTLEIRGTTLDWNRHPDTFGSEFGGHEDRIFDEKGREYYGTPAHTEREWAWHIGSGPYFKIQVFIIDFPADSKQVIFDYDWYNERELVIDLPVGGEQG